MYIYIKLEVFICIFNLIYTYFKVHMHKNGNCKAQSCRVCESGNA